MKRTPRLARVLVIALLFGSIGPSPEARHDAQPNATEWPQYKPAPVVPALGLRG